LKKWALLIQEKKEVTSFTNILMAEQLLFHSIKGEEISKGLPAKIIRDCEVSREEFLKFL